MKSSEKLRLEIAKLVEQFAAIKYEDESFKPGRTSIPASGKVIGSTELQYMVDASLDGWLTAGRFNKKFETEILYPALQARYENTKTLFHEKNEFQDLEFNVNLNQIIATLATDPETSVDPQRTTLTYDLSDYEGQNLRFSIFNYSIRI